MNEYEQLYGYLNKVWGEMPRERFDAMMANESQRRQVYDKMKADGLWEAGYDSFPEKKNQVGNAPSAASSSDSSASPAPAAPAGNQSSEPTVPSLDETFSGSNPALNSEPDQSQEQPQQSSLADLVQPAAQDASRAQQTPQTPQFQRIALTGDEDPVQVGAAVRGVDQYRAKYNSMSQSRMAQDDTKSVEQYGRDARMQMNLADYQLKQQFGDAWQPALAQLQQIAADPQWADDQRQTAQWNADKILQSSDYKMWQGGQTALSKASATWDAIPDKYPEYKANLETERLNKALVDEQGGYGTTGNWFANKTLQLVGKVAALPREIGLGVSSAAGVEHKGWNAADAIGNWGDNLIDYAERTYPKPSFTDKSAVNKEVSFDDKRLILNDKGGIQEAYDKQGNKFVPDEAFTEKFKGSGLAESASYKVSDWANVAYKGLDMTADMLLMARLGGGTKVGTMLSSAAFTMHDAFQEGLQGGLDAQKAAQYAIGTSLFQGGVEAYLGNIETRMGAKMAGKEIGAGARRLGMDEAKAVAAGKISPMRAAWTVAKPILEENGEEFVQSIGDKMYKQSFDKATGAFQDDDFTKKDAYETLLMTSLVTLPMAGIGAGGQINDFHRQSLVAASQKPEVFAGMVDNLAASGRMDAKTADYQKKRVELLHRQAATLPDMHEDDHANVLALQDARNQQQQVVESDAPDAVRKIARDKVKEYDTHIGAIVKPYMDKAATGQTDERVLPDTGMPAPDVSNKREVANAPEDVPAPAPDPRIEVQPEHHFVDINKMMPEPADNHVPAVGNMMPEPVAPQSDHIADVGKMVAEPPQAERPIKEVGDDDPFKFLDQQQVGEVTDRLGKEARVKVNPVNDSFTTRFNSPDETVASLREDVQKGGEAMSDAVTNIAINQLHRMGYQVQPGESEMVRRFFVPHFSEGMGLDDKQPGQVMNDLVREYMGDNKVRSQKLTTKMDVESPKDFVADWVQSGGTFTPESWYRNGDRNAGVSALYLSKENGRAMDDLALEMSDKYGMSEADALEVIVDFMMEHPKRNVGDYMRARIEEQQRDKFVDELAARYDALMPEERDMKPADKAEAIQEAEQKVEAFHADLSEAEQTELDKFLDKFKAPEGEVDMPRLLKSFEEANTGFDPDWLELSPRVQQKLENLLHGQQTNIDQSGLNASEGETSQAAQPDQGGQPAAAGGIEETGRIGSSDRATVERLEEKANREGAVNAVSQIDAALAVVALPTSPTPGILHELLTAGHLTFDEFKAAVNADEAAMQKAAAAIESLRQVNPAQVAAHQMEESERAALPEGTTLTPPLLVRVGDALWVSNADDFLDILDAAGGVRAGNDFYFPLNQETAIRTLLMGRPLNATTAPTIEGGVTSAMGDKQVAMSRHNLSEKVRKAKTLDEKLDVLAKASQKERGRHEKDFERTMARLGKAFPNVEVVTDPDKFDAALAESGHVGERPGAFVWKGKVYQDPTVYSAETAAHEFGHLWNTWAKANDPEHHAAGQDAMRGSQYEKDVRASERYAHLKTEEEILDEALAVAIGERGARIMDTNLWTRFQTWLDALWYKIERALGVNPYGRTARQFADRLAARMLSGDQMFEESSERLAELEKAPPEKQALAAAVALEKNGTSRDEIERRTGWFRASDGKWQVRAYDEPGKSDFEPRPGILMRVGEILDAPDFFEEHPEARGMVVLFDPEAMGTVERHKGGIVIRVSSKGGLNAPQLLALAQKGVLAANGAVQIEKFTGDAALLDARLEQTGNQLSAISGQLAAGEVDMIQVAAEDAEAMGEKGNWNTSGFELSTVSESPKARYTYGRRRILEDAVVSEVKGLIDREVATSGVKNVFRLAPKMAQKLGIDEATIRLWFAESAYQQKLGRFVPIDASQSAENWRDPKTWRTLAQVVTKWAQTTKDIGSKLFYQFDPLQGLPKEVNDARMHMLAMLDSHNAQMGIILSDLQRAMDAHFGKGNVEAHQMLQNAWESGDENMYALLPSEVRSLAKAAEKMKSDMSLVVVQMGILNGEAGRTVLQNAGVDLSGIPEEYWDNLEAAFSKPPNERTPAQQDFLDNAIASLRTRLGSYLYRSYRIHDVKDYVKHIPDWIRERAANKFREMYQKERARLEGLRAAKAAKLQGKSDVLQDEIDDLTRKNEEAIRANREGIGKINDALKQALADLEAEKAGLQSELDVLAQQNMDYKAEKGRMNKAVLAQIRLRASKMQGITDRLARADEISKMDALQLDGLNDQLKFSQESWPLVLKSVFRLAKERAALESKNAEIQDFLDDPREERVASDAALAIKSIASRLRKIKELEAKQAEVENFRQSDLDLIDEKLANIPHMMAEYLATHIPNAKQSFQGSKLGQSAKNFLARETDEVLPEEIRDLLGEYRDPILNMAKSMAKISQIVETQRFLNRLKEDFTGIVFFESSDINGKAAAGATIQIAAETNRTLAPLNGMFVTPEIHKALTTIYAPRNIDEFNRAIMVWTRRVKIGKTILSLPTQETNFLANLPFALIHGWHPKHFSKAFALTRKLGSHHQSLIRGVGGLLDIDALKKKGIINDAERAELQHLMEIGALGTHLDIGNIEEASGVLHSEAKENFGKPTRLQKVESALKGGVNYAIRWYQFGDGMFRAWGYYAERERLAKRQHDSSYDSLSDAQKKEIDGQAMNEVNRNLPTYSYLPPIVKTIQSKPIIGSFIAWQYEMLRVSTNLLTGIARDIKTPGAQRHAVGKALRYAAWTYGLDAIGHALATMWGVSDDDEEKMRWLFLPWYMAHSQIWILNKTADNISYIDIGHLNPFGWMKKGKDAFSMTKGGVDAKIMASMKEMAGPMIEPEMTMYTVLQVLMNVNADTKNPIRNEDRTGFGGLAWTNPENLNASLQFAGKRLQPGFAKMVMDVYNTYSEELDKKGRSRTWGNLVSQYTTGQRTVTQDFDAGLDNAIYRLNDRKSLDRSIYSHERDYWTNKLNRATLHKEGLPESEQANYEASKIAPMRVEGKQALKDAYDSSTEAYNKVLDDARTAATTAYNLGMSLPEIKERFKSHFSADKEYPFILQDITGHPAKYPALEFKPKKK